MIVKILCIRFQANMSSKIRCFPVLHIAAAILSRLDALYIGNLRRVCKRQAQRKQILPVCRTALHHRTGRRVARIGPTNPLLLIFVLHCNILTVNIAVQNIFQTQPVFLQQRLIAPVDGLCLFRKRCSVCALGTEVGNALIAD